MSSEHANLFNERHPASWKLWLQDLALDSLETSAGDCPGMV